VLHLILVACATLAAIAGGLKGAVWIYRRAVRPAFHAARQTVNVGRTLTEIAGQFSNNHGSTLRDAVDAINNRMDGLDTRMTGQDKMLVQILDAVTTPAHSTHS
jgi:hypothetical protein